MAVPMILFLTETNEHTPKGLKDWPTQGTTTCTILKTYTPPWPSQWFWSLRRPLYTHPNQRLTDTNHPNSTHCETHHFEDIYAITTVPMFLFVTTIGHTPKAQRLNDTNHPNSTHYQTHHFEDMYAIMTIPVPIPSNPETSPAAIPATANGQWVSIDMLSKMAKRKYTA